MKVVGVGCGPGMLTEEAIRALREATAIYGSRRAIALARGHIRTDCPVHEMRDFSSPQEYLPGSVLLSTGDPMLAGLGHRGDSVVPGISSLQVACARLGVPLSRTTVVDAHGRDPEPEIRKIVEEAQSGRFVFLLADPPFPLAVLASALCAAPEGTGIAVCEDLGYPGERIECGTPAHPPRVCSRLFSLVIGPFGQR